MKNLTIHFFLLIMARVAFGQGVGIGTSTPHASAAVEVSSVTQGMLVPRMTTAQREMISSPATGLLVFDITTNTFWFRGASSWTELVAGGDPEVHRNGPNTIYLGLADSVGIGTMIPTNKVDIHAGSPRTGSHTTNHPLYVTGDIGEQSNGIEFLHNNSLQGLGFGYNTIYAAGTGAVQDIRLAAKGTSGSLLFSANTVERMRITGEGRVGIGTNTPGATLEIARGTAPFGAMQINGTNYQSHFNYGTPEDTYIRGGKPGAKVIINDFADFGNVGIGTANPLQKLHVGGKLFVENNLGIGSSDPHAPLQFSNALENRKIVLYESADNDHQYFGFGVNGGLLRYQATGDHVFYYGENATTSKELIRITSNGRLGIGVSAPDATVEIMRGTAPYGALLIKGTSYNSHFNYGTPEDTYIRGGKPGAKVIINDFAGFGSVGIGVSSPNASLEIARGTAPFGTLQINGTNHNSHFNYGATEDTYIRGGKPGAKVIINDFAEFGNVGIGTANPLQKLHVGGKMYVENNLGIGFSDPHAPLQFANALQNRKIVLWDGANNDHEFYGFGVNGSILRYQVSNTNDNHIFYAGTSAENSNELMRIRGNGNVDVAGALEIGYVQVVSGTVNVSGVSFGSNSCNCPAGTVVIGGGHLVNYNGIDVAKSYPSSNTSWYVTVFNSNFETATLQVVAICARLAN